MPDNPEIPIAHIINLAVAPVFLLTGIGAILTVMTNRLGRIIDRARTLEERLAAATPESAAVCRTDLSILSRRARLIYVAITLCTTTALLICTVIAIMFLIGSLQFNVTTLVTILFIAAMSTFFFVLVCFLREIYLGTISLRIGAR